MREYNEQEKFWSGNFGDEYIERNVLEPDHLSIVIRRFSRIFEHIDTTPKSFLEFGCNIGINLKALSILFPNSRLEGIEINAKAVCQAKNNLNNKVTIIHNSIFDYTSNSLADLVFTSGVLIHIEPSNLKKVYSKLYDYSSKYILIIEYFNPTPVEVEYRGYMNKLFKRDFAGDMMDLYKDLTLIDYGFFYQRSPVMHGGDVTFFLLKK